MTTFDPPPPPPGFSVSEQPHLPTAPTRPSPPKPPKPPAKSRSRLIILAALVAILVIALVAVGVFFVVRRNLNAAVEEATVELQSNLQSAGNAQVELVTSIERLEAEELTLSGRVVPDAKASLEELTQEISEGEELCARADDPKEPKRPLLEEIRSANETLRSATVSAEESAETLNAAIEEALLNAAAGEYQESTATLEAAIATADQLLADSEGNVSDNVARDALQARVTEAKLLLDRRPTSTATPPVDGVQSGGSDTTWTVARYEQEISAIASLLTQIDVDSADVEAAVAAKAEADRVAAEAEAARIAAEQAAAASQTQTTRKYNNGCKWEKDENGWLIGWKALGWCTEEDWLQYRDERDAFLRGEG